VTGYGTIETIEAIAVKSGFANSAVATATITISNAVAPPTFSPVAGTYYSNQNVIISDVTAGATIFYTVTAGASGTTPTTSSTVYSGAIPVTGNGTTETIEAIAVKGGLANSAVATATITILIPTVYTVAGNGTAGYSGDGGLATAAQLNGPWSLAVDSAGDLYIADRVNNRVREVSAVTGIITTVAGNGTAGYSGDGDGALGAQLNAPRGVALDSTGNLYIGDTGNNVIRKVSAGIITTVAGNGTAGYSGNGGLATNAQLNSPRGIALDRLSNLYIADQNNNVVREVNAGTGNIATVAGNGTAGFSGDGWFATAAQLHSPDAVFVDGSGNLYIADNANNRVRRVAAATLFITTVAGNGMGGYSGDGGPATAAQLSAPRGVVTDATGNMYIGDSGNNRVRRVDAVTGIITTAAGNGTAGYSGDGGPATAAQLNSPRDVVLDASGNNLYVGDEGNSSARKVSPP
jgi:hypothetical protein